MATIFQQNPKPLAKSLVGKKVKVGRTEIEILQAEGYSRRDNEGPTYAPVLTMEAGQVYCPRHRGGLLVLVACHDGDRPGGCVLIRKIFADGKIHNGPGRVAEALGITDPQSRGRLVENENSLTLRM